MKIKIKIFRLNDIPGLSVVIYRIAIRNFPHFEWISDDMIRMDCHMECQTLMSHSRIEHWAHFSHSSWIYVYIYNSQTLKCWISLTLRCVICFNWISKTPFLIHSNYLFPISVFDLLLRSKIAFNFIFFLNHMISEQNAIKHNDKQQTVAYKT